MNQIKKISRIEYLKRKGWGVHKIALKGRIRAQNVCYRIRGHFYRTDLLGSYYFSIDEAWRIQMIEEQKPYSWKPDEEQEC